MDTKNTSIDNAKRAAGYAAADLVQEGMLVGLGTGSTAAYFIERLAERTLQGLKIEVAASSERSWQLARQFEIPIADIEQLTSLDFTADGADEIDAQKRMIKGGGGALLREKILASISREMVVIIDEHKLVEKLGSCPLPVEITPFAWQATYRQLQEAGFNGKLRSKSDKSIYLTDNGNYIIDIHFDKVLDFPEKVDAQIKNIPGVMGTGFFFNLAKKVLIGYPTGKVELRG